MGIPNAVTTSTLVSLASTVYLYFVEGVHPALNPDLAFTVLGVLLPNVWDDPPPEIPTPLNKR
jgi:hypothetical protein